MGNEEQVVDELAELVGAVVDVDGGVFKDFDTIETFATEAEVVDTNAEAALGTLLVVSVWSNITKAVGADLKAGEAV